MAKYGFIIDVDRCNGCYSCFLACKDEWIGNDHGTYGKATEEGMNLMRVKEIEYGTFNKVKVDYIAIPCQHCQNAPCVLKRPDAFYKREDGLVILDPEKSADKSLLQACPYGCVQWNETAGIAQKCNGCAHMLDKGEKQTRCSEVCPNQALIFGDLDDPDSEISKFAAAHADELEDFQPAFAEQVADLVQEAGLAGALATEVDQDLVAAVFLDQSGDLFFGMLSEHDLRRSVVVKISHGSFG